MTVAHPIERAWLSTGGTGAQNYDEFADDAEITAIVAANPWSALGVEMPHRAPDSLGKSFAGSLPDAVARLAAAKEAGRYEPHPDVAVVYGITEPDGGRTGYGLWCMVDTDQISTSADEPGLVIRNEDVFIEKVRERVALATALGHLLSPVLLMATDHPEMLAEALAKAATGTPVVSDVDPAGRRHELWPIPAGPTRDELLDLAGQGELVVADGNHRSLAAQTAGYPRFLAVVTTPDAVTIQPYNRLVTGLTVTPDELLSRLPVADVGSVTLYFGGGREVRVALPAAPGGTAVENLDHALVERVLFHDALGMDAGDKRITYVGGDYGPDWLRGEVDAGRAQMAVMIPPVTVEDFVAVNLARQKLPRKSTWFTPKARAGLVVSEI